MHVIKKRTLVKFWQKHAGAEAPLRAWFKEVDTAEWKTTQEIRARFGSADFLSENRVVFNIGGNKFRLVVKIAYTPKIVYIRFIGTHAEYDRINAETI